MKKKNKKLIILITFFLFLTLLFIKSDSRNTLKDIQLVNHISILDKNNDVIYEELYQKEGTYIKLEAIDNRFIDFVIQMEDKRFYNHYGFDSYRISFVMLRNLLKRHKHGASTITQQYVKNLYLNNKKTYSRKFKELIYSVRLEKVYSKDEILEGYLNTIYFGNNIYGISDACRFYFNKTPTEIDVNEMSLLLTLIKSPNGYSPLSDYEKSMAKKDNILMFLRSKHLITNDEFKIYYNTNINIHKCLIKKYSSSIMYFKDVVLEEFNKLNIKPRFNENIVIHTNFEKEVNEQLDKHINLLKDNDNASCVILDKDGYYVSLIGGKNYYESPYNIALNGNRDIGSTIKPLLYYNAINDGFTPLTTFYSSKKTFKINNTKYEVTNYNDVYDNRPITLGYALATSDNIYAVKTHLYLGMDKLNKTLNKFNITSNESPTLALGNTSTSLKNLTSIYLTLANLGLYKNAKAITKITCSNETIYKSSPNQVRKLKKPATYVLNNLMQLMFDDKISNNLSVTGSSINQSINVKTSGKSGLTDYDSYMIGFNNHYCVGIWSGHVDNELLVDQKLKSLPKKLYTIAFNSLNIQKDISYDTPKGVYYKYVSPTLFNKSYKKNLPFLR